MAGSATLAQGCKEFHSLTLYRPLPLLLRLNVLPFLLGYIGIIVLYLQNVKEVGDVWLIGIPVLLGLQVFSLLLGHWSTTLNCWFTCRKVSQVQQATLVRIIPLEHLGSTVLCDLHCKKSEGTEYIERWFFFFQKTKYLFHSELQQFKRLDFPTSDMFRDYLTAEGLNSKSIEVAHEKWGKNRFEVPEPTFLMLFKEQALAPFFIFQLFCVLLWCLDDYWYYSLLTLFLLLVLESTVVKTRLQNIKVLRDMSDMVKPKHPLYVYRDKRWSLLEGNELLPGDICSIVRAKEDCLAPCDILLLYGTCVADEAMLTGESTPQLKESVVNRKGSDKLSMSSDTDKLHIIYSGTSILQTNADTDSAALRAPDGGCVGYVLRTGFYTSQGKLLRTMLFSSERVTANTKEGLLFILCLLCAAIAASGYVLVNGLKDENKDRYKLFVECALIITSAVPPELPTELSLAVNTSLVALRALGVFCTEPFRIPFAGKLDICCFDKTGTLTDSALKLAGIAGLTGPKSITAPSDESVPDSTTFALAGCHSLVFHNGAVVGDSMETASFQAINWAFAHGDVSVARRGRAGHRLHVVKRFPFVSVLQRMSTVISLDHCRDTTLLATAKGAPEAMQHFFDKIPDHYEETYKHYSRMGFRVLALGYKSIPNMSASQLQHLAREDVESSLTFAGFTLFQSTLKDDSAPVIDALLKSSHKVVMITGDNILTACSVAQQLRIVSNVPLIFSTRNDDNCWISPDERHVHPATSDVTSLIGRYDLCVAGPGLDYILEHWEKRAVQKLLPEVKVWARVSPLHKQRIVAGLRANGLTVLMCGDGTNDVGALKQAHVGVALLPGQANTGDRRERTSAARSAPSVPSQPPSSTTRNLQKRKGGRRTHAPSGAKEKEAPNSTLGVGLEGLLNANESSVVKLGDASVASPFTSKSDSICNITSIVRQGRCTLVTTLQMYKILALNCLTQAYALSVLYLDGVKLADSQATLGGMLVAICFLFISRSKPLSELSRQRPVTSVFSFEVLLSIVGQFLVHLGSLLTIFWAVGEHLAPPATPAVLTEEAIPFKPNIVNTVIFIISCALQTTTFAVNYRGRPFMEGLTENKGLFYSLCIAAIGTLLLACELLPEFNAYLELIPLENKLRLLLLGVICADFILCFCFDRLSRYLS